MVLTFVKAVIFLLGLLPPALALLTTPIGCGTDFGCFSECNGDCKFLVTWMENGDSVNFTLSLNLEAGGSDQWIALGLSYDTHMGNTSVTDCVMNGSTVQVLKSYNEAQGYLHTPLTQQPSEGISNAVGTVVDGVLNCAYTQTKTSTNSKIFELESDYILLVANGLANSGVKSQHSVVKLPSVSTTLVDFQSKRDIKSSAADKLTTPEGCGTEFGCFSECNGDCKFVVTWVDNGDTVDFTLSLNLGAGGSDQWIALGLSYDTHMGNTSVTDCVMNGNTVEVIKSYNEVVGDINTPLTQQPSEGITNAVGTVVDGVLKCAYTQTKTSTNSKIFELEPDYILLVANGLASSGVKSQHSVVKLPSVSTAMVDFQSKRDIKSSDSHKLTTPEGCGTEFGCFSECNGDCKFVVTWMDNGDTVNFTLSLNLGAGGSDQWIALGLSYDTHMGNTSVTDCVMNGNTVQVVKSYNEVVGDINTPLTQQPSEGISNAVGTVVDGVLKCVYTQTKTSTNSKIFELESDYILLVANGLANSGVKSQHSVVKLPSVSTVMVDFQSKRDIKSSAADKLTTPAGCGTEFGCFSECNGDCKFVVTWVDNGDTVDFTLSLNLVAGGSDQWIALGLSYDTHMGNTSVTDCVMNGNTVQVVKSYNEVVGDINTPLTQQPSEGISNAVGTVVDGVLNCAYTQTKTSTNSKIFELEPDYILLVANGLASSGVKSQHSVVKLPSVSTAMVDFQSKLDIKSSASHKLTTPEGCGTEFGCFSECNGDCKFVVTWLDNGDTVNFTLSLNLGAGGSDQWIALGLSYDTHMGNTSVTDCVMNGNTVQVIKSYNEVVGDINTPLTQQPSEGISNAVGTVVDGVLKCAYTQTKTSTNSKIFELESDYILLVANGLANSGVKSQHSVVKLPSVSTAWRDIKSSASHKLTTPEGCGTEFGCFSECNGDCKFVVTWMDNGDTVNFTLSLYLGAGGSDQWIALGLSYDTHMGNTSVTDCVMNGNTVQVVKSYNEVVGDINTPLTQQPSEGISNAVGTVVDGVLKCVYTQTKTSTNSKIFELESDYILLVANGLANSGVKSQHSVVKLPSVSTAMVDFQSKRDIKSSASHKLTTPEGCGTEFGCFSECNGDCKFVVTWLDNGDTVYFTLSLNLGAGGSDQWIALGLSYDTHMGNTSVTDCVMNGNTVQVIKSYNEVVGDINTPLTQQPSEGISNAVGTVVDGVLKCAYTQTKTSTNSKIFELESDYILLVANGLANSGVKSQHSVVKLPSVSTAMVDFQSKRDIKSSASHKLTTPEGCGTEFGCFSECNGDCKFVVTWMDNGDTVNFTLSLYLGAGGSDQWIALGLSYDTHMGNTSVTDCVMNGNTVQVVKSYNEVVGDINTPLTQQPSEGISNAVGTVVDGVLKCVYTQTKTSTNSKIFELESDYILLVANGLANSGVKSQHSVVKLPSVSTVMVDFQSKRDIKSSAADKLTTPAGCGTEFGCFSECNGDCKFVVTWVDNGDTVDFTLSLNLVAGGSDQWIALGLSYDTHMGNTSVTDCVMNGNTVQVVKSYNEVVGDINTPLTQQPSEGISDAVGTVVDGVLKCAYTQTKTSTNSKIFELESDYILLVANGLANSGMKSQHSVVKLPSVSAVTVDFQSNRDIKSSATHKLVNNTVTVY